MSLDFFAEADCSHMSLTGRGQQSGCRTEAKHREVGGGGYTSVGLELSVSAGCRKGELVLKHFPSLLWKEVWWCCSKHVFQEGSLGSNRTSGRMFDLHVSHLSSITSVPYGPLNHKFWSMT